MIVNGKEMTFDVEITVNMLLETLKLNPDKVVVEVDLNILSKDEYPNKKLSEDSKVEIIQFVGGGW